MAIAKAKKAPEFSLLCTDGNPFVLANRLRETPLVLFFFKSSCPVCQLSAPFVSQMSTLGVPIVAICQDLEPLKADGFANRYAFSFPVVVEQKGYQVSNLYEIDTVPTLFVVDQNGVVSDVVECFDRVGYERVAERFGVVDLFHDVVDIPIYRPG